MCFLSRNLQLSGNLQRQYLQSSEMQLPGASLVMTSEVDTQCKVIIIHTWSLCNRQQETNEEQHLQLCAMKEGRMPAYIHLCHPQYFESNFFTNTVKLKSTCCSDAKTSKLLDPHSKSEVCLNWFLSRFHLSAFHPLAPASYTVLLFCFQKDNNASSWPSTLESHKSCTAIFCSSKEVYLRFPVYALPSSSEKNVCFPATNVCILRFQHMHKDNAVRADLSVCILFHKAEALSSTTSYSTSTNNEHGSNARSYLLPPQKLIDMLICSMSK